MQFQRASGLEKTYLTVPVYRHIGEVFYCKPVGLVVYYYIVVTLEFYYYYSWFWVSNLRPTIMGNILSDYVSFYFLTGISDAKNKNNPLWDQKSSLFLGS